MDIDVRSEYNRLLQVYNQIRANQKPSSARTATMTKVVSEMAAPASYLKDFDIDVALKSQDAGERLSGYAYSYTLPDYGKLPVLISSVVEVEDKPFGQYWGIQAMDKVLNNRPPTTVVDESVVNKLRRFQSTLGNGTARHYTLGRILQTYS